MKLMKNKAEYHKDCMRILFEIGHPARVHFFKYALRKLQEDGHNILICVREREKMIGKLLNAYNYDYINIEKTAIGLFNKGITMIKNDIKLLKIAETFNPNLLIGGMYLAHIGKLTRVPHISFWDSEPSHIINMLTAPFTTVIITPEHFKSNIVPKQKHISIKGYKELAYLHPNWFKPNPDVFNMLGISKGEKYVILRFSAFDGSHDIGIKGFSLDDKRILVKELEKCARVFISSELKLPNDLEKYAIKIPPHKMHDALYYASLLVGDTGTMVTEAGILGTPAIISHPKSLKMSNFIELEKKYGLIFNIREPRMAIEKAVELIQQSDLKQEWKKKRENLLKEKIDVTAFMTWFIENYPESFKEMKENPEYQEKFR